MARQSNIGITFSDFYPDRKFINVAKGASRVLGNNNASDNLWYDNTKLNSDMYPIESTYGINFQALMNSGTYVVRWKGSGSVTSVSISNKTNASSGIYTGGGSDGSIVTNGRYTFTANSTTSQITWVVKGTTISDLVICLQSEESLLDSGKVFRQPYITLLQRYNGVLRFMDTGQTNGNILCNWADREPTTAITYNTGRWYTDRKCGLASGAGDTYTVSAYTNQPVNPTHGEIVQFTPNVSNTVSDPTLTVGTWPAKTVKSVYSGVANAALSTSGTSTTDRLLANQPITVVYDGTLDAFYMSPDWYGRIGHPPEIMIAECNESGCPGWFCIPLHASDDYVTQFATLLCTTYNQSVVYIEYSNEVWNAAFGQTTFASNYGTTILGLTNSSGANWSGWYGYRLRQISSLMRTVFANYGQSSKLKMVLASQGAAGDDTTTLTNVVTNVRLQNTNTPTIPHALDAAYNNAPYQYVDVLAYALYFKGATITGNGAGSLNDKDWSRVAQNAATLKTNVDLWNTGTAANIKTAFDWARDDFLAKEATNLANRLTNWNNLAATYGKEIRLYEGNWEVQYPGTSWCDSGTVRLFANSNKVISSNVQFTTLLNSLGLSNSTGSTDVGGDTLSTAGLNGLSRKNKAGNAISSSTALSGSAGTDSVGVATGTVKLISTVGSSSIACSNATTLSSSLGITSGATFGSTGLTGSARSNKASATISSTTLLSGSAGTNSVAVDFAAGDTITIGGSSTITFVASGASGNTQINVTDSIGTLLTKIDALTGTATSSSVSSGDFVAGNTITVNSVTITFVASGASGNTQINVTDTIGTLLAKIDAATGTSTPSLVVAPALQPSSTYGGQGGLVDKFIRAFMASYQAEQMMRTYIKDFYALSQSGGWSLYFIVGGQPWLSFAQTNDTSSTGDTLNSPLSNFNAIGRDNNGKRRFAVIAS